VVKNPCKPPTWIKTLEKRLNFVHTSHSEYTQEFFARLLDRLHPP
jgi:hypothetical protein